jgi:hypothetical protein
MSGYKILLTVRFKSDPKEMVDYILEMDIDSFTSAKESLKDWQLIVDEDFESEKKWFLIPGTERSCGVKLRISEIFSYTIWID